MTIAHIADHIVVVLAFGAGARFGDSTKYLERIPTSRAAQLGGGSPLSSLMAAKD
jgi:hypothetical protein